MRLVLSLFPGIGLLDRAFEEEGFCVVRGPDPLWGGDIRCFFPPAGVFAGVIGGPPCQAFSPLANINRARGREPSFGNLIPEFERVVSEAAPDWFVMENVRPAPLPEVSGYVVRSQLFNNRWLGEEQNRERRISFGTRDGRKLHLEIAALESPLILRTVTHKPGGEGHGPKQRKGGPTKYLRGMPAVVGSTGGAVAGRHWRYTLPEACRLQGLPEDFLSLAPFTAEGKLKAVANGVPLPMGRAIARAVKRAVYGLEAESA